MIRRYWAEKDNTITNAFSLGLKNRATGSNMGASDILEVFSIYGRASSSAGYSPELSRALLQFPMTQIISDRASGKLPASGSVSFFLKLFNAEHNETTPRDITMSVMPLSQSWEEGVGLDMDTYQDKTYDKLGSNWIRRSSSSSWANIGGSTHSTEHTQSLDNTTKDIKVDITSTVEDWISSSIDNNGLLVKLSETYEAYYSSSAGTDTSTLIHNPSGAAQTFYTKKFFGKDSEYFLKRPVIESVHNDAVYDDRYNFFASSSLAPAADNLNTLTFYNYIRGRLVNIPSVGTGSLTVKLYSGSTAPTGSVLGSFTAYYKSTGIYTASAHLNTSLTTLFDVWSSSAGELYTGSITVKNPFSYEQNLVDDYVISVVNGKKIYRQGDEERVKVHFRKKNWKPQLYNVATNTVDTEFIRSASYQVTRTRDDFVVIPYNTGSLGGTVLSYNLSGNYFDFDFGMLESGYSYYFSFSVYDDYVKDWVQNPRKHKFRVEKVL